MCHLQQHKQLLSPVHSQLQFSGRIFRCTNCNERSDAVRDLTQHLKTYKRNKTPSPRTPKTPARKLTPKHLTLEQNPSIENVQNPSVQNVQNPSAENVKYPVVNKKVFISPPAVNHSFNQELSKEAGSVNLTECITCNVCKSILSECIKSKIASGNGSSTFHCLLQ